MDEEYLSWLLLIPGIGRKRAELLAEKYPSMEALRAASDKDVAGVEGFGPVLAKRVRDFVEVASAPGGDYWYKDEAGLYLCPNCGAMIGRDATSCPFCHTALEGEEAGGADEEFPELTKKIDDLLQPEGQTLSLCPNCGALVGKDVAACPKCDTLLEGEEAAAPEGAESPAEEIDLLQPEGQGLYLCPECGALVSEAATACPK
ncbi:MAG TPA: zinc ribbon domain-containing protein, partial [Thermoplasmata archaeon]|nr:zinc ribbon domain-containing protein [Thermoplasmata archaeon]